ncbi:hypothetical protein EJ04DRAFT_425535 [Polyplosphaeria fusca]|uniref:Copper-fist domain-containing protein n=1 Tax=Polyplosphaeria fusca TaxID=682080 RepID=A0A9P4R6I5_9PLEO|nr:hypothetical protein EJ04DRAFT_425535 [Polyplosphaeria fusca]
MWAEINGERKKVACGPCIRGHRSSKCDHRDRVLVEVRKPGRPLSSCPHPSGSCSCERVVINYTIPKTSECACPPDRPQTIASLTGAANRVQKSRNRKSTTNIAPLALEKAIKASQDAQADSSSLKSTTPTNPSFAPSDRSASNEASPPSSASSTPRILPSSSQKQSTSDCCKPKMATAASDSDQKQGGSCCGNKPKEPPNPTPTQKSCCGGSNQSNQVETKSQMGTQPGGSSAFPNFAPMQQPGQFQTPPFGMAGFNYLPHSVGNAPGFMGMSPPFGFNTPIYNHMPIAYQHSPPMTMTPGPNAHNPDHNCHCGDTCSCFGCAAHPHNATMMEYVRSMHHYMSHGEFGSFPHPTYDVPAYPHGPVFLAGNHPVMAFNSLGHGSMPFQPSNANPVLNFNTNPSNPPATWQQPEVVTPTFAPSASHDTSHDFPAAGGQKESFVDPKTEQIEENAPSPMFADSPNEGKDEDTPILSPSSFFWQELVLPGCNDETGTCQCGDGCECVGCLTHGGHNGVLLDMPTSTEAEQNSFNNFISPTANGHLPYPPETFSEAPA